MDIKNFIKRYREAFGGCTPLPIAIGYSNSPATEVRSVPKCMIGSIRKVCDGNPLTLSADNVTCVGGGLYTAFKGMAERIPMFVSEIEHYKKSKDMVVDYIKGLDIRTNVSPYLNFIRIDNLEDWNDVDALLFFATPDMLSGLCSWAFYDNNSSDAVTCQFASGCASIVTFAINENRQNGRRCFLGMLDPSARPLVPENELSFTIPMSRFKEMCGTMSDSALFQKAFSVLKCRINER